MSLKNFYNYQMPQYPQHAPIPLPNAAGVPAPPYGIPQQPSGVVQPHPIGVLQPQPLGGVSSVPNNNASAQVDQAIANLRKLAAAGGIVRRPVPKIEVPARSRAKIVAGLVNEAVARYAMAQRLNPGA